MIRVACATCGEFFEVGDEFAGLPEFCPACGALNDIPQTDPEPEILQPEIPQPEASVDVQAATVDPHPPVESPAPAESINVPPIPERGIPSWLWWAVIIAGPVCFVVACLYLLSDNWESRHVQALSDAANRGDVLMMDDDYSGAAAQYRSVLDTVGDRPIESIFIRDLMDRSRRGQADAEAHLRAGPTTAPEAVATTVPSTQPEADNHPAIKSFQRDSETFADFVRGRPRVFQDGQGYWRRRLFTIWDVTYQQDPQSDPLQIQLEYSCASRITGPHEEQNDADGDDAFVFDESPKTEHVKTTFELRSGQWFIVRHDIEALPDTTPGLKARPSLDDFYDLERRAFGARSRAP